MVFAAHVVSATVTDDLLATRRARSKSVLPGVWHADLEKAKAYAETNGVPLIAVWSNGDDCSHCLVFERMAMAPAFTEWMKNSGYVFYFGVRYDGQYGPTADGQEGYHGTSFYWCRKKDGGSDPYASHNWPYVRIYWRKTNGVLKVDEFRTGATIDGEYDAVPMPASKGCTDNPEKFVVKGDDGTYNPSARYFIDRMTNSVNGLLRSYVYNPEPPYRGCEFGVLDARTAPQAGLQLEQGTALEYVTVPLTRTNTAAQAYAATNSLVVTYPSGYAESYQVNWAPTDKTFDLDIATKTNRWTGTSECIDLVLYEGCTNASGAVTGKAVATCSIALVEKMENSPVNPLWIGEKTSDQLAWGEWTMDFDAATNKVNACAAAGEPAYTLVLVTGPLWSPDCIRLKNAVLESEAFRSWANDNRIACVAVDVPKFVNGGKSPTLLNREVVEVSSSRMQKLGVSGKVSGAGYLSRKGITLEDAAAIQARNLRLITTDTSNGGLKLPEPTATATAKVGRWETGVPCLIMLRPDGTVCGRIYQFSNSTEGLEDNGAEKVIERLKEICAQASERVGGTWAEENNDSVHTTHDAIEVPEVAGRAASLSFADEVDYYRINAPSGTVIRLDLTAADATSDDAMVGLSVVNGDLANPDGEPVADGTGVRVCTGRLGNGNIRVFCELPSDNCYARVLSGARINLCVEEDFFAWSKESSTVCKYVLRSDLATLRRISFLAPDADGIPHDVMKVCVGQTLAVPDKGDLSRLGYSFVGWSDGGRTYSPGETLEVESDLVLTAVWSQVWSPAAGSCMSKAMSLQGSQVATLVNEYDPELKEFYDDGVRYYKVILRKGCAYTIYIEGGNAQDIDFYVDTAGDDENAPWAMFDYEWFEEDTIPVAYLYADAWDEEDPTSGTYYVCLRGEVGAQCRLHFVRGIKSFTPEALGMAAGDVDGRALSWSSGGDSDWSVCHFDDDDGDCVRSGAVSDDSSSWLEAVVQGPGKVSFDWKVSSETYKDYKIDYLAFSVDDEELSWIGGETDWGRQEFAVAGDGMHRLRWSYEKDDEASNGEDCGWIRNFSWLPFVTLTYDLDGGQGDVPAAASGYAGDQTFVAASAGFGRDKHDFAGWSDGIAVYMPGDAYVYQTTGSVLTALWIRKIVASPTISCDAQFWDTRTEVGISCATEGAVIRYTLDGSDPRQGMVYSGSFAIENSCRIRAIACKDGFFDSEEAEWFAERMPYDPHECLNASNLVFRTGGAADWARDRDESHDGIASMRSGTIGDQEQSWLETVVTNAGEISFWWRVSSESYKSIQIDFLTFSIDGVEQDWIGGECDWTYGMFSVEGDGEHVLRWTYRKDATDCAGEDAAWLDEVVWSPAVDESVVTVPGQDLVIPKDWVDGFPDVLSVSDGDYAQAVLCPSPGSSGTGKTHADGTPVLLWEDYVAGTDPSSDETFHATVQLVDGKPVIRWSPALNDTEDSKGVRTGKRLYEVKGSNDLGSPDWQPVEDGQCDRFRFFKVEVRLP